MTLAFDLTSIPGMDTVPETSEIDYPCQQCGREAGPYSGRGRKPTKCVECKPNRAAGRTGVSGGNEKLAALATDALCQINGLMALGAMITGFIETAGAITSAEEDFKTRTHAALLTDPALCRTILKAGTSSAKIALCISYAFMGVSVLPTAVNEVREKKALRAAALEEEQRLNDYPSTPRER